MTPRQHEAIAAIRDLTVDGVGPTYDQLAERLGCASRGHAFGLVARLERAGLVTRQPNQRRSLRIVEDAVSPAVLAALSDAELRNTIAHSAPGQQQDIDPSALSPKTAGIYGKMARSGEASAERRYTEQGATNFAALPGARRGDSGSAARFFYSAKADAEDRLGSKHPTVKPVDLMAWLCRLVTPPGGVVLDPFAGTGTTGLAALRGGFSAILIEREAQYVADIERRLAWARGDGRLTAQETARTTDVSHDDLPLFSGDAA